MDKHEAARILYGNVPGGDPRPLAMMDLAQMEWMRPEVRETWKDNAWHGVWWVLYALVHDDKQALESGRAYLELTKRGDL